MKFWILGAKKNIIAFDKQIVIRAVDRHAATLICDELNDKPIKTKIENNCIILNNNKIATILSGENIIYKIYGQDDESAQTSVTYIEIEEIPDIQPITPLDETSNASDIEKQEIYKTEVDEMLSHIVEDSGSPIVDTTDRTPVRTPEKTTEEVPKPKKKRKRKK